MHTPPGKTRASLRAQHILLAWNAYAQNDTRVCFSSETYTQKKVHGFAWHVPKTVNAFAVLAKRDCSACGTGSLSV